MDLTAVAKNELPEDLRGDERVAKVLPAFYRTLRKKELSEEEIRELLDLIRGVGSFSEPLFQICQKLGKEADGNKVFAMADSNYRKALGTARMPKKKIRLPK